MPSAFAPSVGGVEELTRRLGLQLVANGHDVEIWTSRSNGDSWLPRDVVDGLPVIRSTFPAPKSHLLTLAKLGVRAPRELLRFRREIQRFQPDVLHVQCFSSNGAYATALSRLTDTPLVVTLQGETMMDDHNVFEHSEFLRRALRHAMGRADAVTACSQFTLDDAITRFGLADGKGQVIFNGVDLDEPGSEAMDLPFPRFVLAMGRVVEKKGFDLLLHAWKRVCSDMEGVGLVIGGDGRELPALRRLVEDLALQDRVHFAGPMGRGNVAWAMRQCEAFVMPSRLEPFGIVVLEAWRAGAPVVASSRGGAPEFVADSATGLVVDPFDTPALTRTLLRLLTSTELRAALGAAGGDRVRDFQWREITAQYERVYTSVIRRRDMAARGAA